MVFKNKLDTLKTAELLTAAISVIGLLLKFLHIPGALIILIVSLTVLSCYYFLLNFALVLNITAKELLKKSTYNNIKPPRIIGAIATGIALSTLVMGILFRLLKWPGNEMQLTTGIITSGLILLISFFKGGFAKSGFYKAIQTRLLIYLTIGIFLILVSIYWIEDIQYKNHPEFLELYKKQLENPEDEELRKEYEKARDKMIYGEYYREEEDY